MQRVSEFIRTNAKFLLLIVIALILAFCRDTAFEGYSSNTDTPQITIDDFTLCEPSDSGWIPVSEFEGNSQQYFCAQMTSDVSPVRLTLLIQKQGHVFSLEYSDADEFVEGLIIFEVKPSLSPGQYIARIVYARRTLGKIEFNVTK
jgi:hypothetical protein